MLAALAMHAVPAGGRAFHLSLQQGSCEEGDNVVQAHGPAQGCHRPAAQVLREAGRQEGRQPRGGVGLWEAR